MYPLIYRGVPHIKTAPPTSEIFPWAAKDLIYRGHRHDGSMETRPRMDAEMRYRGVVYWRLADGSVYIGREPSFSDVPTHTHIQ